MTRIVWLVALALVIALTLIILQIAAGIATEIDTTGVNLALAVAFLFPVGLALVAWSVLPSDQSDNVAALTTLGMALALIGYLAFGFALQFGGVASVTDNAALQNLSRFFSAVRGTNSAQWGLFGLDGFFLAGDAATSAAQHLLLSFLPLVTTVVLIVLLALPRDTPPFARVLVGSVAGAITYPLAGNWVSGGGWLAHLGSTFGLGHGLVDFGGIVTVFVVGGAAALAAALTFGQSQSSMVKHTQDDNNRMPASRYPILAAMGAPIALIGWTAVVLANPLNKTVGDSLNWFLIFLNALAGLAGGTFTAQIYGVITTGRFDPLMGSRGALAGLIVVSAGAPFIPTWSALLVGCLAGLLLPVTVYVTDQLFHLDDPTAAIASYVVPGLLGLIAVAVFADGRWGHSWNGAAGLADQGVSGLLVAPSLRADRGQLAAQVWGGIALFALGFLVPWGSLKLIRAVSCLRLPTRTRLAPRKASSTSASNPSSESKSAAGSFDRVINVDDGG